MDLLVDSPEKYELRQAPTSRLLLILTSISLGLIAIPLIYLVRRAVESELSALRILLIRPKTAEILVTTIGLTVLVSIISTILGLTLAWILHNVALPYPNLSRALIVLPIAIPSYVFTYTWMSLSTSITGFAAATFILVLSTTPFVSLATLAALRRIDGSQHEVAQTLGLNAWATFLRITLPQIRNSVAAGALLVALYVLSDFGAVSLLGVDTLTRSISNIYRGSFDRSSAAVLALVLVMISAVIILAESRFRIDNHALRAKSRSKSSVQPTNNRLTRALSIALVSSYVSLGLIVPLATLLVRFVNVASRTDVFALLSSSLATIYAASLGALIALFIALPLGILSAQGSKIANASDRGVLLVHALPGIVMGLSLVAFGSEIPWLYQTLGLLAFAYAVLFTAKSVGAVRSSLMQVPKNLVEISSTLGQRKSQTLRRVVLPLSAPGIMTGSLLVFLAAMKELPATLMLRPNGFDTLATEMWRYTSISKYSEAAPYALFLVLIAALPTFFITRPDKREMREGDLS